MSKWSGEITGFKIPDHRPTGCLPFGTDGKECEFHYVAAAGECWEGFICSHPEAIGNKGDWLVECPTKK